MCHLANIETVQQLGHIFFGGGGASCNTLCSQSKTSLTLLGWRLNFYLKLCVTVMPQLMNLLYTLKINFKAKPTKGKLTSCYYYPHKF